MGRVNQIVDRLGIEDEGGLDEIKAELNFRQFQDRTIEERQKWAEFEKMLEQVIAEEFSSLRDSSFYETEDEEVQEEDT